VTVHNAAGKFYVWGGSGRLTGSMKLTKKGAGGLTINTANTYTGGTQLQAGRLYLLGTSEASTFAKDTSNAAAGVAGTGTIVWDSAAAELPAELYLGHGTRIYNNGTTSVQGGTMTIGVEAVPSSELADFVVTQSGGGITVTMGGVKYVEIDTHNLKSIAVNALYADGTAYVAGTDIDRNKMLLVKMDDWETAKTKEVTSLSDNGYNEAVYSGTLSHSDNVTAELRKIDVVLSQLPRAFDQLGSELNTLQNSFQDQDSKE
jgi:autotransporter-associated beta strand protein